MDRVKFEPCEGCSFAPVECTCIEDCERARDKQLIHEPLEGLDMCELTGKRLTQNEAMNLYTKARTVTLDGPVQRLVIGVRNYADIY